MQLSIVFQGSLSHLKTREQQDSFIENMLFLKKHNEDSELILSTWVGEKTSYLNGVFDLIIHSKDPGALPGLKFDDKSNNVNRLIVSSQEGVRVAKGRYIVKLRTDLKFYMSDICRFYKDECDKRMGIPSGGFGHKIISPNLFTIDPVFVERMPYHISDWFQLGEKETLRRYWNIPLYPISDALHYNFNRLARYSNFLERQFQSKLAVEQYLTISAAKNFGYEINMDYHNDYKGGKISMFYDFLTENFIIKDMQSLRLINDKYSKLNNSIFYKAQCITEKRYNHIYKLCMKNNSWIRSDLYGFIISVIGTTLSKIKKLKSRISLIKRILSKI